MDINQANSKRETNPDAQLLSIQEKNKAVLDQLYCSNKQVVTKQDLIKAGFDFSEFFSTSEMKVFFDIEENTFEYKDFFCGKYFVKTRDADKTNFPQERLLFQLIKFDFSEELKSNIKHSISLLRTKKISGGEALMWRNELKDEKTAESFDKKFRENKIAIDSFVPNLKESIQSIKKTKEALEELLSKLNDQNNIAEHWL